jgi:hypothetical protein
MPAPRGLRSFITKHASSACHAALWGFGLRVAAILVLRTYRFDAAQDYFEFGYETGRIARALALGQGFSNPFHGVTGPTAWEAPGYPLLVGGIFQVAGIYTLLSAFLVLTVNSFFSALTAVPLYRIAHRLFGLGVAKWTAWAWALLPLSMYWATRWVWETSLSALLVTSAFWLALECADAQGKRAWRLWLCHGFLAGIIALTNPSCLTFLPFSWGWACWMRRRQGYAWLPQAAAALCLILILIMPWQLRNYRLFHRIFPIRSNAGAELRLGNGPEANGRWMYWLHPTQNAAELQKYRQQGEVAYVRNRGREARDFMAAHPGPTALLWLKKAAFFWAGTSVVSDSPWLGFLKNLLFLTSSVLAWLGLALVTARRMRGAGLFAALLLIYPVTYYIIFPHARYRHPIEPILLLLIVYLITAVSIMRQRRTR